jgi:hypothetical protein
MLLKYFLANLNSKKSILVNRNSKPNTLLIMIIKIIILQRKTRNNKMVINLSLYLKATKNSSHLTPDNLKSAVDILN